MAYSRHQRRVIHHILSVGHRRRATQKEMLTALVVGLHESALRNLHYGDRDSEGWRQERKAFYKDPTNVRHSAMRFFDEEHQQRGKHLSVGQLAQAVQRSGNAHGFEGGGLLQQAKDILHEWHRGGFDNPFVGGGGGRRAGGRGKVTVGVRAPSYSPAQTHTDWSAALVDSLRAGGAGRRHGGLIQDAMRRVDTGAYTTETPARESPGKTRTLTYKKAGRRTRGGGAARGHTTVRLAGGADRPGVTTSHYLRRILSGVVGIPGGITITTGSNHSRMTTSGNVSDHWSGHAGDISVPVDSRRGDLIAGRVLMRLGVSRRRARQMARHGGLFNVNYHGHRWQVIWKTNEGGNHHNHVHVGVR